MTQPTAISLRAWAFRKTRGNLRLPRCRPGGGAWAYTCSARTISARRTCSLPKRQNVLHMEN